MKRNTSPVVRLGLQLDEVYRQYIRLDESPANQDARDAFAKSARQAELDRLWDAFTDMSSATLALRASCVDDVVIQLAIAGCRVDEALAEVSEESTSTRERNQHANWVFENAIEIMAQKAHPRVRRLEIVNDWLRRASRKVVI